MGLIIKIAALFIGANLLQDPKPCGCQPISQTVMISGETKVYIMDFTKTKCKLSVESNIKIIPDNSIFDPYRISIYSSRRGLIEQLTVNGTSAVVIGQDRIVYKNEKIWIEINGSPGIATIQTIK